MGIVEETKESESATKKWVISGIHNFMTTLKPIYTKKEVEKPHEEEEEEEKECNCTTPTTPESQIPVLKCPRAPKKRKSVSRNHCNIGVSDYFKPPELETVFLRCVERP